MPAITTTTVAGTPLDAKLQEVLITPQNEWDYFFIRPNLIEEIFEKLTNTIRSRNFFNEDYSIKTFFDFLKSYVNAKLTQDNLINVDSVILRKFNDVWSSIQNRIIQQHELNEEKCDIIKIYIGFIHGLLDTQHRDLFAKAEITFSANDFQNIAVMLKHNSASINAELIESYTSLLKLSFDTPKFLANFELGLGVIPLAKASFLNKEINIHIISTRFFDLLGYQGQLLDYYHKNARFNITNQLLADANVELKRKVIELQMYFFQHLQDRDDIDKPLLQHYLYTYFFKVFFEKYPDQINALKTDLSLFKYIKFDYVALPKKLICKNFPLEYVVHIEYNNLPADVPEMACEAIRCSYKTNENWKQHLNLPLPRFKSHYTFRVTDSYAKYPVTYSYGYAPMGGGFYIQKPRINGTVYGEGYSYWGNDTHNFIDVSRHEARHHDNYVFTSEAYSINPKIMGITVKSPNEGLAVNANGPCAPGFIDRDFTNVTAPSFSNLFEQPFIGYFASWLDTNYLIQEHPDFYRDSLSLDKQQFKRRWEPLLIKNQQHFWGWLPILKQTCKSAPKKLTLENCPSIFLEDYASVAELNKLTTQPFSSKATEALPKLGFLTTRKPTPDEMGYQLILKISDGNFDEFRALLQNGANANYLHENTGNTPLHFLYFYGKCNVEYLELLLKYGAKVTPNLQGQFPLQMAEKKCDAMELLKIQEALTRHAQQQELWLPISIPISALTSGVIAGVWQEVAQRNKDQYPYLPNIILYGLKPSSLAMGTAFQNVLLVGTADVVGLEDFWGSFVCYLAINYLGLLFAQIGEGLAQKIQNKVLNLFISILLYTFLLNPTLLIELVNKGLTSEPFSNVMPSALLMLLNGLLIKTSEYCTQKFINLCIPRNEQNANSRTYINYKWNEIEQDTGDNSRLNKYLMEFKDHFTHLKKLFDPILKNSAHLFIFKKNLNLLQEIADLENINDIDANSNEFSKAVTALNDIKEALAQLDKIPNKKPILKFITNKMIPAMNAIRPSESVNHAQGLVIQAIDNTAIELTTFKETPRYTRTPQLRRISSLFYKKETFPPPPPPEELEKITEENLQIHQNNGQFYR